MTTPKIRMLCFVLINNVRLNLLCVWISGQNSFSMSVQDIFQPQMMVTMTMSDDTCTLFNSDMCHGCGIDIVQRDIASLDCSKAKMEGIKILQN